MVLRQKRTCSQRFASCSAPQTGTSVWADTQEVSEGLQKGLSHNRWRAPCDHNLCHTRWRAQYQCADGSLDCRTHQGVHTSTGHVYAALPTGPGVRRLIPAGERTLEIFTDTGSTFRPPDVHLRPLSPSRSSSPRGHRIQRHLPSLFQPLQQRGLPLPLPFLSWCVLFRLTTPADATRTRSLLYIFQEAHA